MTRKKMTLAAACLLAVSLCVKAGDLTVDNLTLYGKLEFANETVYPASGGTITTYSNYIIHTFTSGSNDFVVSSGSVTCDVLVVTGGGAGGRDYSGGGGGAGGLIFTNCVLTEGEYGVVIGAGGCRTVTSKTGAAGSNSSFNGLTAVGGGGGAGNNQAATAGGSGGGGGGTYYGGPYTGGSGTTGQGHAGGSGGGYAPFNGCGGGGAGSAGGIGDQYNCSSGGAPAGYWCNGGNGGEGLQYSISGTAKYYAGGGGGAGLEHCAAEDVGGNPGIGGSGGGGTAGWGPSGPNPWGDGDDGEINTGGGGGATPGGLGFGGAGGSGIVIVRYPMPTNITETASIYGINQNSASATNIFLGKVGIGTNSPSEKLHVAGNIKVDGMVIMTAPSGGLSMGVFTNQ